MLKKLNRADEFRTARESLTLASVDQVAGAEFGGETPRACLSALGPLDSILASIDRVEFASLNSVNYKERIRNRSNES